EDVGKVVAIVPGDAVAAFGGRHGFAQGDAGLSTDIVFSNFAEAARFRAADRRVSFPRIFDVETAEELCKPVAPIQRRWMEGSGGKWSTKQDDTEIGVVADDRHRRLHREANAYPDRDHRHGERRGRHARARFEIRHAHAWIVGEAMHIARLQCIEFGQTGITKGLGNLLPCEGPCHAPSWSRSVLDCSVHPKQTSRNGATMESAMRVRVTRCNPCHAGMLFTSSTSGVPERSWMMSTPA